MTWKTVAIMTLVGLVSVASRASAQVCVPPPSGLVAWWPGDGTTEDVVGGHDGLWQGFEVFVPGVVQQTFGFNGNALLIPHDAALTPTNAITVEAWVKRNTRSGDFDPLVKKAGEDFRQIYGYALEYIENGLAFFVYLDGIGWQSTGKFDVADGEWNHVAGVYDGAEIRLYVNGALALIPHQVVGTILPSTQRDLYFASDPENPDRRFHGYLDEVMIFDRALSAAEIQGQYLAGSAGQCKPDEGGPPSTFWVGLKNSDDQGTQFDLRMESFINGTLVSASELGCITGLTRNPALARDVNVATGPGSPASAGDVLSVRLLTRIGTNLDGTKCPGPGGSHNNATGLRLYFDSSTRPSRVTNQFTSGPSAEFFLHATGTTTFLDGLTPIGGTAKTRDSGPVNFAGGNPWKTIGTWTMTVP